MLRVGLAMGSAISMLGSWGRERKGKRQEEAKNMETSVCAQLRDSARGAECEWRRGQLGLSDIASVGKFAS